jgi:hypothetical protein
MSQKNINKPPQSHSASLSAGVAPSEHTPPGSIHSEEHDSINSEKLISKNDGLLKICNSLN